MSANRLLKTAAIATGLVAVLLVGVALAAPLPKGAKAYSTDGRKHGVALTFVTSTSGKAIEQGSAALGSQYPLSGGSLQCPKAKKNHGFHEAPFALFGFPGAKLKLSHGKFGFTKTIKTPDAVPLGSSVKPFTLKVTIAGSVASPTSIKGTLKAKGGPCTTKKPVKFDAKLDEANSVAPGQ